MPIVFKGVNFPNGGSANWDGRDLSQIDCLGTTVWKKNITLLDGSIGASNWGINYNPNDSFSGGKPNTGYGNYVKDAAGIYISVKYWLNDGGPIKVCYIPLTGLTSVRKVTVTYSNNANSWDSRSTYFGIRRGYDVKYYGTDTSNSGVTDALTINGTRQFVCVGSSAHSSTVKTFNFGSERNLSSYYFVFGVAEQGVVTGNGYWIRIQSVIVE